MKFTNILKRKIDIIYRSKEAIHFYILFIILAILIYVVIILTLFGAFNIIKIYSDHKINKAIGYLINIILILGLIFLIILSIQKFYDYTEDPLNQPNEKIRDKHDLRSLLPNEDMFKRCENKKELTQKADDYYHHYLAHYMYHMEDIPGFDKNSSELEYRRMRNILYNKYLNKIEELKKDCEKIKLNGSQSRLYEKQDYETYL